MRSKCLYPSESCFAMFAVFQAFSNDARATLPKDSDNLWKRLALLCCTVFSVHIYIYTYIHVYCIYFATSTFDGAVIAIAT